MSILRLAEQPAVSWARFGRYGEGGSFGYQIDASGSDVRNRMMHQDLLPATSDVSLQTRIRLKSSLVTGNPAFEGLAVKHRGFQMEGSTATEGDIQKWDSQPETQGKAAWISGQHTEYTTFNFLNEIPAGLGIDYCTWELELRAISGQVEIDNIECRYFYGKYHNLDMEGEQFYTSGFSIETFALGIGTTTDVRRWLKYLRTLTVNIREGQMIICPHSSIMTGRSFETYPDSSGARIQGMTGLMLKLRRKGTSTYDYMDVGGGYASIDNKSFSVSETRQRRARFDYDQAELIGFNEPEPTGAVIAAYGADRMGFRDVQLDLNVAEFVAPSQS